MAQMKVAIPDRMKARCERDRDRQAGVTALRAAIDEGLAGGVRPRSLDEMLPDARACAPKLTSHGG